MKEILKKIFPFLTWFENYTAETLKFDLVAGVTVSLVVIPQSMAYAQLAGLPMYYGLYASVLPTMIAAMFGSSRHLNTGPTAVVSLLTAVALEPLATQGSDAYIAYAILLALTVGIFRLALGIFKLGSIINFLPLSVVNGYVSAAAIIIATSQLSRIFGVYVTPQKYHYQTVALAIKDAMNYTHFPTLAIAVVSFLIMYYLRKYFPKWPNILIAVIVMTLYSYFSGYEHNVVVSIDKIASPKVKSMIERYDEEMRLLAENRIESAHLREKLKALQEADTAVYSELRQKYYLALLGVKIDKEKHEIHKLRDELNNLKLRGVKTSGGELVFYADGEVPPNRETDGRVWRIKVRNDILDENRLTLMGGGSVVGEIPRGLPELSMPRVDWGKMLDFLPMAAIISLLGFMEAISIAKGIAIHTGQKIDPNRELIGQGLANIVGAIGQSYPVSGSFSRSAVNFRSGGKTGMASVFTSVVVVITLYLFTPLLYDLPKAVLASVIMMAVLSLINVHSFFDAWRTQWYDGAISAITFIVTLAFAPHLEIGIGTGIALSLIVFLYKSMKPRIVSLSMAEDFSLRSAERYNLQECGYVSALRVEGSIFFASSTYLEECVDKTIEKKPRLKHILIVCNGINEIDYTGVKALRRLVEKIRSKNLEVSFSGFNEKVFHVLESTGTIDFIGRDHIYPTQAEAVEDIFFKTHGKEPTNILACPLLNYMPKDGGRYLRECLSEEK